MVKSAAAVAAAVVAVVEMTAMATATMNKGSMEYPQDLWNVYHEHFTVAGRIGRRRGI